MFYGTIKFDLSQKENIKNLILQQKYIVKLLLLLQITQLNIL